MHEAFISYRRENGVAIAKLLKELLKAKGVSAFMDLEELSNGTFNDKLITAIKAIPSFVVILPPGALDRCCDEGDWLAKEIIAAVESGRNIVPVLCDGFTFPKKWDEKIPESIRTLSDYNSVVVDYYYINATVETIIEYVQNVDGNKKENKKPTVQISQSNELELFFRNRMQNINSIQGIDLAFHAGSEWHENIDRLDILTDFADAGVKIRVIINSPEAAESIGKYMRHKRKKYISFSEAVELWQNFEASYDNVEVRISDIPLLRIYYAFRMNDCSEDVVRVKYYTYGNAKINRNFSQNFEPTDAHFDLYKTEFEFLWNNALL